MFTKRICSVALTIAMALSLSMQAVAANAGVEIETIHDDSRGNASFTLKEDIREGRSPAEARQMAMRVLQDQPQTPVAARGIWTYYKDFSCEKTMYYDAGKKQGEAWNLAYGEIYVNKIPGYTVRITGDSMDFWGGYPGQPFYCDSIDASDTFQFGMIDIGGSISVAPGLNISHQTSNSVTVSYPQITNDYAYYHTFDGVEAYTFSSIYRYTHSHSTTFRFGNRTISPFSSTNVTIS